MKVNDIYRTVTIEQIYHAWEGYLRKIRR
jgi:hypothetical protein